MYGYKTNQTDCVGIIDMQNQMSLDEMTMTQIKLRVKRLVEQLLCTCGGESVNTDQYVFHCFFYSKRGRASARRSRHSKI